MNDMLRPVLFSLPILGLEDPVMKNTVIASVVIWASWLENALAGKRAY
jgi:hypothetical protein